MNIPLATSWHSHLKEVFQTKKYQELLMFLEKEYDSKNIYPPQNKIYEALNLLPLERVTIVIIGQDPYHKEGQAQGLSFSVPKGNKLPPSLRNIYKELEYDLGISKDYTNGDLHSWVHQGVLLLNSVLTVEEASPNSHKLYEIFAQVHP